MIIKFIDVYASEDDEENFKPYKKEKLKVILRFLADDLDSKRTYYLDDIMFEDVPENNDVPKGKWLKNEMENNKFFKPAFRS